MPSLGTLTEADIRGVLTTNSMKRARNYLNRVFDEARSGQTLTAQVRGTRIYDVEVSLNADDIAAHCTCPYDWGGYCKHIGAVLLKWVQNPEAFSPAGTNLTGAKKIPLEVTEIAPPATYTPQQLPFWLATPFAERQLADRQELEKGLQHHKVQDLRQIAKQKGWRVKGTRKADIAQQIAEQAVNPSAILRAVASLDAEHKRVLRAMMLLGQEGTFQADDLERVAQIWGELNSYKKIATYTRHLCEDALALPGGAIAGYSARNDFVPRAVARHIPPVLEEVIATDTDSASGELRLAEPLNFVRAANQVALLLEQSPAPLRPPMPRPKIEKFYPGLADWDYDANEVLQAKNTGQFTRYGEFSLTVPPPAPSLPDETIARLVPVAGDETRLEFIYSLLVAAGVFQPGSPVTVWEKVKEYFLRQSEVAQRAVLARIYFRMTNWSALWEVLKKNDELKLKRVWGYYNYKPQHLYADLTRFRQLTLRILTALPDDKWINMSDIFAMTRKIVPKFDQTVWQAFRYYTTMGNWFLAKQGKPLSENNVVDWQQSQGEFIRQIITGPLHWLGLADLSYKDEKLDAVRFHGLADLYWDKAETPAAPRRATVRDETIAPESAVSTEAHRITINPVAVSAQAHSLLDRIARLEVATTDSFVYELDAKATYESFEAGASLAEIVEDWEQLMPVEMPETIHEQLSEWWDNYGQIRVYENLTIIEFADDYALAEMKAVTALEEYLIAEISPRLVVIPHEAVESLTVALEKSGYTPKETEEMGT